MTHHIVAIVLAFVWLGLYVISGKPEHIVIANVFIAASFVIAAVNYNSKKQNQ